MSGLYFKLFQTFLSNHPKKGINVDIRKWENLETVQAWAGKESPDRAFQKGVILLLRKKS